MLITFEGIDGSGKSTQARMLEEHLRGVGGEALLVREPGGTALAEQIRSLLLDPEMAITPLSELLLFSAARTQLVHEVIKPALHSGTVVICDRFYDSTTAYQGVGRGVADPTWLKAFHARVTDGLTPDRTYLLDIPPKVALQRRVERGDGPADRMELGGDEFFERVRSAYLELSEREAERILLIDGKRPAEELHRMIVADVECIQSKT